MADILIAVLVDWLVGDPYWIPHPVRIMGHMIAFEERLVRRYAKSPHALLVGGACIVAVNIGLTFLVSYKLLALLRPYPLIYHTINIYLLYTCLAARCLRDEAIHVYRTLGQSLDSARHRLSYIVGRDTTQLDNSEIIRATVETVAENASDGVIAPLLYAMIGGMPCALTYKMINTMDSMLGYMNEKYRHLGYVSAKIDDVVNFLPARLTGIFMIVGSFFRFPIQEGMRIMIRDRRQHKSPNCAYPEGAMAGLLGIQLGGSNMYSGEVIHKPTIGDAQRPLDRQDILRATAIMFRAEIVLSILYALVITIF